VFFSPGPLSSVAGRGLSSKPRRISQIPLVLLRVRSWCTLTLAAVAGFCQSSLGDRIFRLGKDTTLVYKACVVTLTCSRHCQRTLHGWLHRLYATPPNRPQLPVRDPRNRQLGGVESTEQALPHEYPSNVNNDPSSKPCGATLTWNGVPDNNSCLLPDQ